jgi:hypothetical protein
VLVHFGATLRATFAWDDPDGLATGNTSLAPFARNLELVSFRGEAFEWVYQLTGIDRNGRSPPRGETLS